MRTARRCCLSALFALCGIGAAAAAGPPAPVILGPAEMDGITAGAGAEGTGLAIAVGDFVMTQTAANGVVIQGNNSKQPPAYAAAAEAVGSAVAQGPGSGSNSAAATTAGVPGTFVSTYSPSGSMTVLGFSASGSATAKFGSYAGF